MPLTLAALGIVLRGSSFAFRKAVLRTRDQRNFGAAFAASSVLVPYCMGAVAGAIASGRVPAGGEAGDPWTSWVNPTSILGGLLAISVCAYLSAMYLVWDARRLDDPELAEYFRRRAIGAAIVAGVMAFAGIFVFHADATLPLRRADVAGAARSSSSPPCAASGRCSCSSVTHARAPASSSMGAVATVVVGVGRRAVAVHAADDAQGVAGAAAPTATLETILVVFAVAVVVIIPSLALLFVLDQKSLLPHESVDAPPPDPALR